MIFTLFVTSYVFLYRCCILLRNIIYIYNRLMIVRERVNIHRETGEAHLLVVSVERVDDDRKSLKTWRDCLINMSTYVMQPRVIRAVKLCSLICLSVFDKPFPGLHPFLGSVEPWLPAVFIRRSWKPPKNAAVYVNPQSAHSRAASTLIPTVLVTCLLRLLTSDIDDWSMFERC